MIDIFNFISSYETSEELDAFEIPPVLYDGSYIYDKLDKQPYVILDVGNDEIKAIPITSQTVYIRTFKEKQFIKAYTGSELGELLPMDYTFPIKVDDGWAFVGEDGNIYTDFYYANETDARIMYLLYFLKHKVLTVEDLISNKEEDTDGV